MHIKSRICKQMYADRKEISSCLWIRLRAGGRDYKGAGINLCVMSIFITMIVVILSEIYIRNNQNVHFKHV